ncbi:MAG: hypothetical protein ACREJM_13960, partial [Candidatus Saccharimonadales bacterium]
IKMQTYVGDLTIHKVHRPARIQKKLLGILRQEGIAANPYPTADQPNDTNEEAEEVIQEI